MNATSWVLIEWKRMGYGEICCLVDKWDKRITKRWRLTPDGLLWKLTAASPDGCSTKKRKTKQWLLTLLWRRETSRRLKSLPWRCYGRGWTVRTADETIRRQWNVFAVLNKILVCVCACVRARALGKKYFWLRNLKSGDTCEDLRINGIIILKCFLKNMMGLRSSA